MATPPPPWFLRAFGTPPAATGPTPMDAAGSAPLSRLERDRLALWGEPRSPHEILLAEIRASSGGIVSPSQLSAPASPLS